MNDAVCINCRTSPCACETQVEKPPSVVHIAGLNVLVPRPNGLRIYVQRCASCGVVIGQTDASQALGTGIVGPDGQPLSQPTAYPAGTPIRFTLSRPGHIEVSNIGPPPLPDDFCGYNVAEPEPTVAEPRNN